MLTFAGLLILASHGAAFYFGHRRAVNRLAKVTISIVEHRKEVSRVVGLMLADPKIHIQR